MTGPIDLFLVAGQSNAQGRGTGGPMVTNGSLEWTGTDLVPLADPVGGASVGSAWPAFADAYGQCCVTGAAVGGSGLIAASGGTTTWAASGANTATAVAKTEAALSALVAAGWTPTLRGILWHQGERDASFFPTPATLQATYASALIDLRDRFVAALGPVTMYVAQLGRPRSADTAGFASVRAAQVDADTASPGISVAYTGCVTFADLGLMGDELHYRQGGLDAMGAAMGAFVAGEPEPPPPDPEPPPEPFTVLMGDGTTADTFAVGPAGELIPAQLL